MRLLDLFEDELEEASYNYSYDRDNVAYFYGTRKASIPSVVVINDDRGSLMHESNMYTVGTIKSQTVDKRGRQLLAKSGGYSFARSDDEPDGLTQEESEFLTAYKTVRSRDVDHESLKVLGKIREFNNRRLFYKFITIDLRMPLEVFEKYFGESPELEDDDFILFRDARVFFPDNVRESSKKTMLGLVAEFDKLLSAKKLDYLMHGDIRFVRIPGKTVGQYYEGSKDIRITPSVKKSKDVVFVIIHEFGHKLYYEYIQDKQKTIKSKYMELLRGGVRYKIPDEDSQLAQAKQQLKPGLALTYKGRKKNLKRAAGYIITSVEGGKFKAATIENPERNVLSGALASIINNNKWEIESISKIEDKEDVYEITEDWFPTKYSQKDHEEWFAELFAYYVASLLRGEPLAWMESII